MRTQVEQAWANRLKAIRTAIRLKHSIAADNELNAVVEKERKEFMASVLKGQLPKHDA